MKNSLNKRSLDNVTVVIIAFSGFKETVTALKSKHKRTEHSSSMLRNDLINSSHPGPSKNQRSSSQAQILGKPKGFATQNNLM